MGNPTIIDADGHVLDREANIRAHMEEPYCRRKSALLPNDEWDAEAPLLKARPSEYMTQGNWFYATEPEEESLPYVIDRIGDDRVVFASDYPHWDGMFPYVVSTIRERKDMTESSKRKILGENAKKLYGWD